MLQDGHYGDWPDISKRQVGYHELVNYPKSFLNLFCYVSGSLKTQDEHYGRRHPSFTTGHAISSSSIHSYYPTGTSQSASLQKGLYSSLEKGGKRRRDA